MLQNRRVRVLLHWIPALIGIAVIIGESTATMSSENTSRWLLPLWTKLFGPIGAARWEVVHHYIRKTGHFVGYGMVSVGFFDSWRVAMERRWTEWQARFRNAAGLAVLSTLLQASWDERHQSFLPGRTSSPRDVAIDLCGAVVAQLVLLGIAGVWRKRPGLLVAV